MWFLFALACERSSVPLDTARVPTDPSQDTIPTVLSSAPCDACDGDCLLEELSYPAVYHASEPIDYLDLPPAGGPHDACWATWGVHPEPVEDDRFVHNLEHGGVVFLYDCEDCAAEVDALASLATDKGSFALVSPYDAMEGRFATVAWGWRLTTGCVDPLLDGTFYDDHVNQAPESVPSDPSASCL